MAKLKVVINGKEYKVDPRTCMGCGGLKPGAAGWECTWGGKNHCENPQRFEKEQS